MTMLSRFVAKFTSLIVAVVPGFDRLISFTLALARRHEIHLEALDTDH